VKRQTHYDATDKNIKVSFEDLGEASQEVMYGVGETAEDLDKQYQVNIE
jgi:hypothetical protein